jgi:hypothetical protein
MPGAGQSRLLRDVGTSAASPRAADLKSREPIVTAAFDTCDTPAGPGKANDSAEASTLRGRIVPWRRVACHGRRRWAILLRPWHYDASAHCALRSSNLRQPAISYFAFGQIAVRFTSITGRPRPRRASATLHKNRPAWPDAIEGQSFGRRRSHGCALSSSAARPSKVASSPKRPTNWVPIGNPVALQWRGRLIAGWPVAFCSGVIGA